MTDSGKQAWRASLRAGRAGRDADRITAARAAVRAVVLDRARAEGWRCVAGYVPLRTEPGSLELLAELSQRGVRVLLPRLLPDRDLDWVGWDPRFAGELDPMAPPGEPVGTGAIAEADAVLVPALAVARDGTRLGRGGGSYDRALARARPGARLVALLYDEELVAELPRDPWDVRVTAAATPSGWWEPPDPSGMAERR